MWSQRLIAPHQFRTTEVPTPGPDDIAEGELLVRLRAGGICGSDLPAVRMHFDPQEKAPGVWPLHEIVGDVIASKSASIAVGQRVIGWAKDLQGLVEVFTSYADQVVPVEPDISDVAAVVAQPLACVMCAIDRFDSVAGRRVAVIGQGPIGLLFSHVLKSRGASEVVGIDTVDRSDLAADFGVDKPIYGSSRNWAATLTNDERPMLVVEAVGHQVGTLNDAITAAAVGGQIMAFGVNDDPYYPIDFHWLFRKNLTLHAGITTDHAAYLKAAQGYLRAHPGLAERYVTNVLPINEVQQAFEIAARPSIGRLKVVLTVDNEEITK